MIPGINEAIAGLQKVTYLLIIDLTFAQFL